MTVSAATLGVALSAPVFGALAERLPRKRVIVASLLGVSIPTLLAATSTSLAQLIFWRFLQGITVPGIIAVVITYIGEEWPPDQVALIMSFYVSGTALGGLLGRISSGILADRFSWRVSFLVLGAARLAGAAAVAAWLPHGRRRAIARSAPGSRSRFRPPGAGAVSQPPPGGHFCRRIQRAVLAGRRLHVDHLSPERRALSAFNHRAQFALLGLPDRTRGHACRRLPHHPRGAARRNRRRHRLRHDRRSAHACAFAAWSSSAGSRCSAPASSSRRPPPAAICAWQRLPGRASRLPASISPAITWEAPRPEWFPEPSGRSAAGRPASALSSPCRPSGSQLPWSAGELPDPLKNIVK